jgi:serine/threonine protein kinase
MTPERWRQIEQLYHAALERAPGERASFLDQACAGDGELRREVESLLASHEQAGTFIDRPPDDVVAGMLAEEQARSMTGRTLGHYKLQSLLGAGGMGEVYRARDLRLDRDVAVKLLPEHLAGHPDALKRFEREAKAVAALSHPNILAIHDFGAEQGLNYAVMELLEGETLRSRLTRSPLGWREAAEIGAAVAEGLSAAHAKGIIHRDLKPENVFLTTDGGVKILDFGLARVKRAVLPDAETLTTIEVTKQGVVMGTPGYMSPEQVRGEVADAPSDLFSFGCVLHEMISGRRPFARATAAEMIVAILNAEPPPLIGAGREVPVELERVIRRCLAKKPQERRQSARDLASVLKSVLSGGAIASPSKKGRRLAGWAAAGLVILAGALIPYSRWPGVTEPAAQVSPTPGRVEVLKYCLELESSGDPPRRVTGTEPLAAGQMFRFHFTPRDGGYLYIVAPGANNAPTTFLTAQPVPASGVTTNRVEAGADFNFPAGAGNGIELGRHGNVTTFTIIFSASPLTEPGFLAARAYRQLTAAEQRELGALWQRFGAVAPELMAEQASIAVTLPADYSQDRPLIFDIPIKRR